MKRREGNERGQSIGVYRYVQLIYENCTTVSAEHFYHKLENHIRAIKLKSPACEQRERERERESEREREREREKETAGPDDLANNERTAISCNDSALDPDGSIILSEFRGNSLYYKLQKRCRERVRFLMSLSVSIEHEFSSEVMLSQQHI